MIRLLIAEDHAAVRRGLMELFESTDDITVVAECVDGFEVLMATTDCEPHVALLDLVMPRMDGLQTARLLRENCPDIKVVMLSASTDSDHVAEARRVGAVGFIAKGMDPAALPAHVRTVASGGDLWPTPTGE